ncbi:MAG TPA: hypothetical protein VF950_04215 [Planctomycetota bacterium]
MDEDRCRVSARDLRRAVPALRLIFWGALINLVDIRVNGVDLLNDIVGTTLVATGAWTLSALRVDEIYRRGMLFAKVVAILSLAGAVLELARPTPFTRGCAEAVGLLEIAGMTVACAMMVRLSRAAELPDVAAHWSRTLKWFLWIEVGLLGLIRAGAALWLAAGRPFVPFPSGHPSAWIAGILVFLGLLLAPWIRFFQSTSRLSDGLRLKAWARSVRTSSRSRGAAT